MAKRQRLLSGILFFALLVLVFTGLANADLETQLLTDVSPSSGYAPYLQTNWYGSTAIAGKGYCAILSPSSGNSDLYLLDSGFNLVSSSKNTGLTADKIWYGQAVAGAFHVAGFGAANPSSNYTIQIITSPCVKSLSPLSALPGALVTLTGFGFGDTKGTSYVKFGAVTATNYLSWTNTQIQVYLPSGVTAGVNQLVAYVNARASNPSDFTVIGGASSEGTMWQYDLARTGNYPNGPTIFPLNLKWSYAGNMSGKDSVIANNIIYVPTYYGNLYAISSSDGTLKWQFSSGSAKEFATPAIANGIVYGGCDGKIFALDANTGTLKWSYSISGAAFSGFAVSNGIVYAGTIKTLGTGAPPGVYALDANTGALKWSYAAGGQLLFPPTLANNLIYITPEHLRKVIALDVNTGLLKWSSNYLDVSILTTPVVANNVLYAVGLKSNIVGSVNNIALNAYKMVVFAFDANSGTLKWNYSGEEVTSLAGTAMCSSPAISGNTLYFGGLFTEVYALDITTRVLKWSFKSGELSSFAVCSPVFSNDVIYVESSISGKLYAVDANTGTLKWSYVVGPRIISGTNGKRAYSVVIANKKIYFYSPSGAKFYCYGE